MSDPKLLEPPCLNAVRYFPGQEFPELRVLLDHCLTAMAESLGAQPFASHAAFLLLAGGYGRGEGGIYRASEAAPPTLYNDLEFYLALRRRSAAVAAASWCREAAHRAEAELGIEVEFKILPLRALQNASPSMFYYDLLAAHRLVWGDGALVGALPDRLRDAALIPAHEAARLLFNRGSGLYYASRRLHESATPEAAAFIQRNHAKVKLALADAVLTLNGRYHSSCQVRQQRLAEPLSQKPPDWRQLVAWHHEAVKFKFHPRHDPSAAAAPADEQLTAVWLRTFLWLEALRLGDTRLQDPAFYLRSSQRLLPEFPPSRNLLLRVRDRLRRGRPLGHWLDHPRAALQRALVALLRPNGSPQAVRHLLSLPASATDEAVLTTYRRWWGFYN